MSKKELFEIIFEDDDILVINKPAGLLTIPDRYDSTAKSLYTILKNKYEEILTVHRLDRDTSGVLIFAKSTEAHRLLNFQFEHKEVKKIYHAVVSGIVPKNEVRIDIPLIANSGKGGGVLPSARGKESLSILNVVRRYRNATLVEVELVTGRQHQLRAHVAAIGHPLLIDSLYGENTEFYLSSIKRKFNLKKNASEQPIISRITMHSYSISFVHPVKNEIVEFIAEYPKDFRVLIQLLDKYSSLE